MTGSILENFRPRRMLGPLKHRLDAQDEIAKALNVPREIAGMVLYGLIATSTVRSCDDQTNLIDGDECTLTDLGGKPTFVDANDLREWLRDNVGAPLREQRDIEIRKRLPRTVPWDEFCDSVRDTCNGWRDKKKRKAGWGFGDKQIKRIANALMER